MAAKPPTLAQQYVLEKPGAATSPDNSSKEVAPEKAEEAHAAPEKNPVVAPASEETSEAAPEESSDSTETQQEQAADEEPEIKIGTAPADFRFPTTNQTRHCFTRYVEYHRCIAAKGEEAPECDKFKKYYRSLSPGEWVDKWNEQRENGTFPGPL